MKDLVVIGSGFWGTAVYLKAKEAGLDCQVLDSGISTSGSRNAGALTCKRWYKSDTILKHVPKSWTTDKILPWIDWLEKNEYIVNTGQWLYNKGRDTWRRNDDCYITPEVNRFMELSKRVNCKVQYVSSNSSGCVVVTDSKNIKCRNVAVACGMWTDRLLFRSEFETVGSAGLMGRSMLLRADPKALRKHCKDWNGEVASVLMRPYKNFDMLPNNDRSWYFGVTTEKEEREKDWVELATAATYLLGDSAEVLSEIRGYRAVCKDGNAKVKFVDKHRNVIALTGGQKVGLGLAGVAADTVMELLNEQ